MIWPLFELELRYGPVALRPVADRDLPRLADLLPDDFEMDPRAGRFPALDPSADRRRILVQGVWAARGRWSPSSWCLDFGVRHDGELVGVQTIEAENFPTLRTVDSASWLTPPARGRGLGVAMRAAVLGLAFDHLGAVAAVSSAAAGNHASLGVSRRLGYVDNGVSLVAGADGAVRLRHLRLTRDAWTAADHRVTVSGLEPCLPWFGATPGAPTAGTAA